MKPLKLRPGSLPPGTSPFEPASIAATWFWSGLMPFASGTWGSLAALPFAWVIQSYYGAVGLIVATILASVLGVWASNVLVARGTVQDPGFIVIDEVAAMFLTLIAAPRTWWAYLLGFLLFRALDEALLGGVNLSNVRRGVAQSVYLGYWIGEPFAHQGFMTETLRTLFPFVFDRLNLHRIEAACLPHNQPSRGLLEKVGFREEGRARDYLRINGDWQDHVLYALLRSDIRNGT